MIAAVVGGFVAGLAALFHCAGMCGPLCAAACNGLPRRRALGTYLGARLASYSVLGGVAGGIGSAVVERAGAKASTVLAVAVAVALVVSAFRVWPRATRREPELVRLGRTKASKAAPRWAPLAMGALTGLLPCGVLLSALVLAAGSGSALSGAALMLAFGVASSPALFAMGRAASYLDAAGGPAGRKLIAAVLVVGAVITALRPLSNRGESSCHDEAPLHAVAPSTGSEASL